MPSCKFLNHATGLEVEGINFDVANSVAYDAGGTIVYAPYSGTSVYKKLKHQTLWKGSNNAVHKY